MLFLKSFGDDRRRGMVIYNHRIGDLLTFLFAKQMLYKSKSEFETSSRASTRDNVAIDHHSIFNFPKRSMIQTKRDRSNDGSDNRSTNAGCVVAFFSFKIPRGSKTTPGDAQIAAKSFPCFCCC